MRKIDNFSKVELTCIYIFTLEKLTIWYIYVYIKRYLEVHLYKYVLEPNLDFLAITLDSYTTNESVLTLSTSQLK